MTGTATGQRIDQWLWHARLIKSRSLAARLVEAGGVRINRRKITKSGHQIRPGDILTFMYAERLRIVEVVALASRRGPAREAVLLYKSPARGGCEQSTHGDQKGGAQ